MAIGKNAVFLLGVGLLLTLCISDCAGASQKSWDEYQRESQRRATATKNNQVELPSFNTKKILCTVGGALLMLILAPLTIRIIGFKSNGVSRGSLAAFMMFATNGRPTAGGLVASLQRAGANGIDTVGKVVLVALGALLGLWYSSG